MVGVEGSAAGRGDAVAAAAAAALRTWRVVENDARIGGSGLRLALVALRRQARQIMAGCKEATEVVGIAEMAKGSTALTSARQSLEGLCCTVSWYGCWRDFLYGG